THQSSAACRSGSDTDTPARWPAGGSSAQRLQHQPQRRPIRALPDAQPLATVEDQFQRRRHLRARRLGLQHREAHRLLLSQPLPPLIERMLADAALATERSHLLPARLLLAQQLAPILPPGILHSSNMSAEPPRWKSGSSAAYDGSIYVSGATTSLDFPTTAGSFQPVPLVPAWNTSVVGFVS